MCKIIAHAVKGLHDAHIVHADIKENNILLKQTKTGNLIGKIIPSVSYREIAGI